MKIILPILTFLCFSFSPSSSIYEIQVQTLEGEKISFSSFSGSKIIVAEFNAAAPDESFLLNLESIKKSSKNAHFIVVPATDFGGSTTIQTLTQLKADLKLTYDITIPAELKKNGSTKQSALFKWLTNASENMHFDRDVDNDQQLYVISERGTLYSFIGKGTPKNLIIGVLNQEINE